MSMEKFADIYRAVGFKVDVEKNALKIELEGHKFKTPYDDDWKECITAYFKAKQYEYNEDKGLLTSYKCAEFQVVKLDHVFSTRPDREFHDDKKAIVRLNSASPEFSLALLRSKNAERILKMVKRRLMRRVDVRKPDKEGYIPIWRFEDLISVPSTVRYTVSRKVSKDHLVDRARKAIKASLFKLAYAEGECWELREDIAPYASVPLPEREGVDESIPRASYNDILVRYYKVARSSGFANQEFLSHYHILEYHFLRVSDEIVHSSVKTLINSPSFNSSYENINKLLGILKKVDNSSDEDEMLKAVLKKYIPEDDLISYISSIEKVAGKNIYSDSKKEVFGERASIRLEKGHALNNTAAVVKKIRNALVHSSDRYGRENCFLPFSESESVVIQYVPIVKYLAEKIIFTTAE